MNALARPPASALEERPQKLQGRHLERLAIVYIRQSRCRGATRAGASPVTPPCGACDQAHSIWNSMAEEVTDAWLVSVSVSPF